MRFFSYTLIACMLVFFSAVSAAGQITVAGTVYDSTRTIPVKDVWIKSSNGTTAVTDSLGKYTIVTTDHDSLTFIYNNKATARFAVKQIPDIGNFELSLHVRVTEKFRTLKEVKVFTKTYRQDSVENRERYAKLFNYEKPGLSVNSNSYSGAAGLDLDQLINVFRFKRNKQLRKMQQRLLEEEQENYINYRFNKATVRRITRLEGKDLDSFMQAYRPDFEFTSNSNTVDFYQYILDASYDYKLKKEKDNFISARFNRETVQTITGLTGSELDAFMKKYRPSYEFTYNSSPAAFYQYIKDAFSLFRSNTPAIKNPADSTAQPLH